jgi:probable HAF family extracellular repeat protein
MCGRYARFTPQHLYASLFGAREMGTLSSRYNIAPSRAALVARNSEGGPAMHVAVRVISTALKGLRVVGLLVAVASLPSNALALPTYIVTDLGTLGGTVSQAWGINARGQVVGGAYTAGNVALHAILSDGTPGGIIDLGTLGGDFGRAWAINAGGQC